MNIKELLEENPIIAAVKNEEQLDKAVNSDAQIIFVLFEQRGSFTSPCKNNVNL